MDAIQAQLAAIIKTQKSSSSKLDDIALSTETVLANQAEAMQALSKLKQIAEDTAKLVPQVTASVGDMHLHTEGVLKAEGVARGLQLKRLAKYTATAQAKSEEQQAAVHKLVEAARGSIVGLEGSVELLGDKQDEALDSVRAQGKHLATVIDATRENQSKLVSQQAQLRDLAAKL